MIPEDLLLRHKALITDDWNRFRILTEGSRIQVWINDQLISDLVDENEFETHPKGFIGLQVHDVGQVSPFEVAWRNIKIKEL